VDPAVSCGSPGAGGSGTTAGAGAAGAAGVVVMSEPPSTHDSCLPHFSRDDCNRHLLVAVHRDVG